MRETNNSSTEVIKRKINENNAKNQNFFMLEKLMQWSNSLPLNFIYAFGKDIFVLFTQPIQVVMRSQQQTLGDKVNPRVVTAHQSFVEILRKNNGYEFNFLLKSEFDKLPNKLKDRPYLVDLQDNNYAFWGYKNNQWQLIEMEANFQFPKEWIAKKKVFVSCDDEIHTCIKKYHTQSKTWLITPFYRGVWPALGKETAKNVAYKPYLLLYVPLKITEAFSCLGLNTMMSPTLYHLTHASVAGIVSSAVDTALSGWLDSWSTHRSTSHGIDLHSRYLQEVRGAGTSFNAIQRAYRGCGASFVKGAIAFTTQFALSKPISQRTCAAFGIDEHDKNKPLYVKLLSAVLVGSAVAITSSPFDIIKTQSQMPNPSELPILAALKNNYHMHGIKGITAGLPLKFAMVLGGTAINDALLQYGRTLSQGKDVTKQSNDTRKPSLK